MRAKHAVKVHVWAGISKRGATKLCFRPNNGWCVAHTNFGTVSASLHRETLYGTEYHSMQDNDPKHTSQVAKDFHQEKGINWWPIPASTTKFNPIECVWRELKHFIARHVKPLNKKKLMIDTG